MGATGYTGRLASEYARRASGSTSSLPAEQLENSKTSPQSLNLPYRTFDALDNSATIDAALRGISVVLNCAGPFHRTARPLIEACIRNCVHYLDIAAELDSYEHAQELNDQAERAQVMLMPGCGGSVVMLGSLALHVVEQMKSPISISIALHVAGSMSRGSAISAQDGAIADEPRQRASGKQVQQISKSNKEFDFGDGRGWVDCFPVRLPDLITIGKATGVSKVQTFVYVMGATFPTGNLAELPSGPGLKEREENPYHAAVEVVGKDGTLKRAVLHTVNGYSFTSMASIEAAKRVLDGTFVPGFRTPVELFGSGFVNCVKGSTIVDL